MKNKQFSKVKIGLDARTLNVQGGSKTYAENLIEKLIENSNKPEIILFGLDDSKFKLKQRNPPPTNRYLRSIWENISLPIAQTREKVDIFHGLKNVTPPKLGQKNILTIHGTIFEDFNKYSLDKKYWQTHLPIYAKRADQIITISEHSKNKIIDKYDVEENKITIIPQGYDTEFFEPKKSEKAASELDEKFTINETSSIILNVSSLMTHKNQISLIRALNKLDEDTHLFILGKDKGELENLKRESKRLNLGKRVHLLGYVSRENLKNFYNIADVFIYPSLHEGFGLPPLEAMACGTPVIISNRTSLPEVVGDAGITLDPKDEEQLAKEIERVLESDTLQKKMRKKGLKRAEKFSWEKTAKETVAVYEEVLGE